MLTGTVSCDTSKEAQDLSNNTYIVKDKLNEKKQLFFIKLTVSGNDFFWYDIFWFSRFDPDLQRL